VVNAGPFEVINALDFNQIETVEVHHYRCVFDGCFTISNCRENLCLGFKYEFLFHVLNLAKAGKIKKIFWPSSIAVLDLQPQKENTPQYTRSWSRLPFMESVNKQGRWCEYTTISLRRCAA
jgi:hypothetical protein